LDGFARYRLIIEPWLSFLGNNRDHYLFQDKSVIEIVDELLADWKGQGKLAPEWRWDLADTEQISPERMQQANQCINLPFCPWLFPDFPV